MLCVVVKSEVMFNCKWYRQEILFIRKLNKNDIKSFSENLVLFLAVQGKFEILFYFL